MKSSLTFTTQNTWQEYLEGHKLAGKAQQRIVVLLLVVMGAYLLYSGISSEPPNYMFPIIGTAFILYALVLRNMLLKKKIQE